MPFLTARCKDGRFYMEFLICGGYTAAASFKLYFIDGFYLPLFQVLPSIPYKEALIHIFSACRISDFFLFQYPFQPLEKKLRRRNFQSCRFYTGKSAAGRDGSRSSGDAGIALQLHARPVYIVPLCPRCPAPHDSSCLLTGITSPDDTAIYIHR